MKHSTRFTPYAGTRFGNGTDLTEDPRAQLVVLETWLSQRRPGTTLAKP